MARWEAGADARLAKAAIELYLERGFEQVTVAEIAGRAGLTKRTFFRYFSDKREVLFAGSAAFQDAVVSAVIDAPDDVTPIDAVAAALAAGGAELTQLGEPARARDDQARRTHRCGRRRASAARTPGHGGYPDRAGRHRGLHDRVRALVQPGRTCGFPRASPRRTERPADGYQRAVIRDRHHGCRAVGARAYS